LQLISGGQVDIAIGKIDRRTVEDAIGLKLRPLIGGQDFKCGGGAGCIGHFPPMPKPRRAGKRYGTPLRLGRFYLVDLFNEEASHDRCRQSQASR
jgi:hypothetical protein